MIESEKINIVVMVAVIFALVISILILVLGNVNNSSEMNNKEAEYSSKIFGNEIISIDIIADEKDWQQMLDNAINEEYIMVDVIVNGTMFKSVGIRPKGNSSLTQVVNSDSDRYSFRFKFDKYVKKQTCFGLDSFVVNNMIGDNTYMKEYISYDLMSEIGVDAPHFGFAEIKVNGEDWGLYLAVELYNTSYKQRVFNDISGMLYNVKNVEMEGDLPPIQDNKNNEHQRTEGGFPQKPGVQINPQDNTQDPSLPQFNGNAMPDLNIRPNYDTAKNQVNGDGKDKFADIEQGGKGERGNSGGSLEYTDDKIKSYSAIFNNVVGKGTKKDFKRVITALKKLSEGEELEKYFNIDKILRYLAAHTIVVNLDSYSSSMAQNYYIYERDGKITILPWDYNLAWGGFQSGSASSVINFPIDTPVSGVEISSRPLIEKLLANNEYLEKYHSYLQQLITEYFEDGKFEQKVNAIDALIGDYVKNDKTAFCTYEEYKKAVSTFITLGNLRAESVQGQLDGIVPSTTETQNISGANLIKADNLNLSDLGSMMGGREGNNNDFSNKMGAPNKNLLPGEINNGIERNTNYFIHIGVLSFMLIAALLFVVRFKKSY